jgi:hypothetical protein
LVGGAVHAEAVPGQGTWETTLLPRDLDGILANGPEAYFDTALNVTWLTDANFANSSGYVSRTHGPGGNMVFGEALLWAGSLNIGGVDGWRLPAVSINSDHEVDTSSSELSHLYVVALGNTGVLSNTGPFSNLEPHRYWTFDPDTFAAAHFNTGNGASDAINAFRDMPDRAWAVHAGDVGIVFTPSVVLTGPLAPPVPEPESVALALVGVACVGLKMMSRRAKR